MVKSILSFFFFTAILGATALPDLTTTNTTYLKEHELKLLSSLSAPPKKLNPELEAYMAAIAAANKHPLPTYTDQQNIKCGPTSSSMSNTISWSNVMTFPQTSGIAGTEEIKPGDQEKIEKVAQLDIGFDTAEVRENLRWFSYFEGLTYSEKTIQLENGRSGSLNALVMVGRKRADSEIRDIAWGKFRTTASFHQLYDPGCVREGNMYRIEQNFTPRGIKEIEIEMMVKKLQIEGYSWLEQQFKIPSHNEEHIPGPN